jgi:hypothetical protein
MKTITLHLKSDDTAIQVPINSEFEGSAKGTTVWIKFECGDKKAYVVKETPDEIDKLIQYVNIDEALSQTNNPIK